MTLDKMWLLKAFPAPEFVPKLHDVVVHRESGRRALVVSAPKDPDPETFDFDALPEDQPSRPCMCDVMLGEDIVKGIDVSALDPCDA